MPGLSLGVFEAAGFRETLININMICMLCKIFGRCNKSFMAVVKVIQDKD